MSKDARRIDAILLVKEIVGNSYGGCIAFFVAVVYREGWTGVADTDT